MERQIENLATRFDPHWISIVVGFKKDLIMEAFPNAFFVYNQNFGETNTSKSLLKALHLTGTEATLWMNGDVVFDADVLDSFQSHIVKDQSFVAVTTESVGDEEVKYTTSPTGNIVELSKNVRNAEGEAVGINYVSTRDKPFLIKQLKACDDHDYFERGIEMAIHENGCEFKTIDVSNHLCVEVDFLDDLQRVNAELQNS